MFERFNTFNLVSLDLNLVKLLFVFKFLHLSQKWVVFSQIWSLALGTLLRSIVFPTALNAIVLDPGEYALYAGGADGRIFITALNFGVPTTAGILADGNLGTDAALIGHR